MAMQLPNYKQELRELFLQYPALRVTYEKTQQLGVTEQNDLLVLYKVSAICQAYKLRATLPNPMTTEILEARVIEAILMAVRDQVSSILMQIPGIWDTRAYPPPVDSLVLHFQNQEFNHYRLEPWSPSRMHLGLSMIKNDLSQLIRLKLTKVSLYLAIVGMGDMKTNMTDFDRRDQLRLAGNIFPRLSFAVHPETNLYWEGQVYPQVTFAPGTKPEN